MLNFDYQLIPLMGDNKWIPFSSRSHMSSLCGRLQEFLFVAAYALIHAIAECNITPLVADCIRFVVVNCKRILPVTEYKK
eukprot:8602542-Pyramimonas_sp.AAC.1